MIAALQTHSDVIEQFRAAMRERGIETHDDIIADGKLHRAHVDGDRKGSRNAWYCLHADDGRPAGAFGCNRRYGNDQKFTWAAKATKPLTTAERRELRERMERQKQEREEAELARHAAAAAEAQRIWDAAHDCAEHPYLARKQVKSHGLRVGVWEKVDPETGEVRLISERALLVPIWGPGKVIHSLQAIFPSKLLGDRDKDYLTGGNKAGHFYSIGKPVKVDGKLVIVICEGYATGASIHEATGHAVIVAFDAGNLLPVARAIRQRFPDALIIAAADNDQWTLRPIVNPGVTRAREAAAEIGGLVAVPPFAAELGEVGKPGPTDFNDLRVRGGARAVSDIIQLTLSPARIVLLPTVADASGAAYAEGCLLSLEAVVSDQDGEPAGRSPLFSSYEDELELTAKRARQRYPNAALHILAAHADRAEAERVGALHGASVEVAPVGAR